ncbi:HAD-superfamily hydrolase [Eremomyces bilateralis CBS 781.70]|uniref:HAD-superfamily hydrolase n=1 Tax=Eremomyces bilateralis CBS 781.70 TaxID=1392243 RepID=A0A6G1FX21_9PEZI|nr:HAD-superfamily hydrolase [Eremomyces bilateralis CBS 781.70]KAF1810252.1 HAD-superfamily hydrolase [Eremomyces bilateralis CBS 781.70]
MAPGVSFGRTVFRSPLLFSGRVSRPAGRTYRPVAVPPVYRSFQKASAPSKVPDFAFVFDIDGVLLRAATPIPRASEALSLLQSQKIPFILLTNGGGTSEAARVAELSDKLQVPLDLANFVQSHTPFASLEAYKGHGDAKGEAVLVIGGEEGGDVCRKVAESYGFKNVITPGDLYAAHPDLWPFSKHLLEYYRKHSRPLPAPVYRGPHALSPGSDAALRNHLRCTCILVFNDPRDWGLDTTIVTDLLLSHQGYLGTTSPLNNHPSLPNKGYQQDGQPPLYFSNPDLWWAARWHLSRLGQGAFRETLDGLWRSITGGEGNGVILHKEVWGKPTQLTYTFAENVLGSWRGKMLGAGTGCGLEGLRNVYMIGDNPESDIRGANNYQSPNGTSWNSVLVKTGVYLDGSEPSCPPKAIVDDVFSAVEWGMKHSGWK